MIGVDDDRRPRAGSAVSFRPQRPEPGSFWIRHRPARWPGPEEPWLDLAQGRLGLTVPAVELDLEPRGLGGATDLVYLPPVAAERRGERDALAAALAGRGLPCLVQLAPGDEQPPPPALSIYDPLPALLAGDLRPLAELPAGATVVWGLVAGLSDAAELCRAGLERLARRGVARVVPLAPRLEPREKRQLAGADEAVFERLFHGAPASERRLARRAAAAGLAVRLDRPPPAAGTPRAGNRQVAGKLAQIADLWLRLGRPETRAQELFGVARKIDAAEHDLAALAREGNLGVLDWLGASARRQVEAALAEGVPPLLAELEAEYLGGEEEA